MTEFKEPVSLAEALRPAEWKLETRTIPLNVETSSSLMHSEAVVIDSDFYEELVTSKLLKADSPLGIYLAILMTYHTQNPVIDIDAFCKKWGMKKSAFRKALASLEDGGIIEPTESVMQLSLLPLTGGHDDE